MYLKHCNLSLFNLEKFYLGFAKLQSFLYGAFDSTFFIGLLFHEPTFYFFFHELTFYSFFHEPTFSSYLYSLTLSASTFFKLPLFHWPPSKSAKDYVSEFIR